MNLSKTDGRGHGIIYSEENNSNIVFINKILKNLKAYRS